MEIKDIIRKRREELNLTYEQLGNMIGVGKSTVRKWETGMIENMRRDNIVALSKALNISPSIIMGWSNEAEDNEKDLKNLKIENDLKEIIISKYSSIKDFCATNDILYSKVDKIFKKGIGSADIQLIFKICSILDIDVESIVEGEIHFNDELLKYTKIPSILSKEESALLVNFNKLNNLGKEKLIDYSNDLIENPKYLSDTFDEITSTKDNIIKLNSKEHKEIEEKFIPYKSLDEAGKTIAAHDDDLTEEEKKLADKILLDYINNERLKEFNKKHNNK